MFRKYSFLLIFILIFSAVGHTEENVEQIPNNPKLSAGLILGSNGGFGAELYGTVSNLAQGMPMNFRFGVGYTKMEPGISADARRIFINDATNGVPEESGHKYDFKFDMLYPIHLFSLEQAYIYGGPRYSMFKANFKYIGGNEDFDVRSNQWGIGLGLESYFPVSPKMNLVLNTGFDYLKSSLLQGHDTSYDPSGITGNERNDYTYEDADAAINQPKFEIKAMLGLIYSF